MWPDATSVCGLKLLASTQAETEMQKDCTSTQVLAFWYRERESTYIHIYIERERVYTHYTRAFKYLLDGTEVQILVQRERVYTYIYIEREYTHTHIPEHSSTFSLVQVQRLVQREREYKYICRERESIHTHIYQSIKYLLAGIEVQILTLKALLDWQHRNRGPDTRRYCCGGGIAGGRGGGGGGGSRGQGA
jgi:hypothetical protein